MRVNLKTNVYSILEYWVTETYKKMIGNHVHIRSTDNFKQVGVRGKMTEMKSIVLMTNAFGCVFA